MPLMPQALVQAAAGSTALSIGYTRSELGADVPISATTDTTILTVSPTIPATGGPWRFLVTFGLSFGNGGSAATLDAWVTDGTDTFAETPDSIGAAFVGGIAGSGWSRSTYAVGATPTFTLMFRSSSTGTVRKDFLTTPATVQHTHIECVGVPA